jgi:hypothetical protein
VAEATAIKIEYDWNLNDEPQGGIILLGVHENDEVEASWLDSFHMADSFMILSGHLGNDQSVSLFGTYAAPPGPDWGWRILIERFAPLFWDIQMFNVPPDGNESLAFEINLEST